MLAVPVVALVLVLVLVFALECSPEQEGSGSHNRRRDHQRSLLQSRKHIVPQSIRLRFASFQVPRGPGGDAGGQNDVDEALGLSDCLGKARIL